MPTVIFLIAIAISFATRKYFFGYFGLILSKFFDSSDEKDNSGRNPEQKKLINGWNALAYYNYMYENYKGGMFGDSLAMKLIRGVIVTIFWLSIILGITGQI